MAHADKLIEAYRDWTRTSEKLMEDLKPHYRKGLEAPNIKEEATLGMLYDLGNTYMGMNDRETAYKIFVEIYGINTNYRDVVAKLAELEPHARSSSN